MKVRRFRRLANAFTLAAAAVAGTGCQVNTEPVFAIFWTGVFRPVAGAPVFVGGTTEMVANPGSTSVGVFINSDPGEERVFSWHVRNGTCTGSGVRVAGHAAFPEIRVSAGGSGTSIGDIRRRLPAGEYAVEVFSGAETAGDRLACADLTES
jgi:hypothetical protein